MGPFDCAAVTLSACRAVLRRLTGDDLSRPTPCAGYTTRDGLTEDKRVGFKIVSARISAGAGADRMGFVDDEQRAVFAGDLA